MRAQDVIPVGSSTKSWTAVAILQAVEQGSLQLEQAAHQLIDPELTRQAPTRPLPRPPILRAPRGLVTIRRALRAACCGSAAFSKTNIARDICQNGTTMRELWGGQEEVERITLRDLLGMTSGLEDYDDNQLLGWTILNGGDDMGPFGLLHMTNKTLT